MNLRSENLVSKFAAFKWNLYRYTLVWWAEGSLGDFFTDASPPAGALARGAAAGAVDRSRGPAMTPDGFAAVLHLGVGLCKLSAVDP